MRGTGGGPRGRQNAFVMAEDARLLPWDSVGPSREGIGSVSFTWIRESVLVHLACAKKFSLFFLRASMASMAHQHFRGLALHTKHAVGGGNILEQERHGYESNVSPELFFLERNGHGILLLTSRHALAPVSRSHPSSSFFFNCAAGLRRPFCSMGGKDREN